MEKDLFENLEACPYCGSKNLVILFKSLDRISNNPGEFFVGRCQDCKLVFQNPRVKEEFIGQFYPDSLGYYQPMKNNKETKAKKWLHKKILTNHFNYGLEKKNIFYKILTYPFVRFEKEKTLSPKYIFNGSLLEIGSSYGERLVNLKGLGWNNLVGVEMNSGAAKYAQERGLNVESSRIEDLSFDKESFDVIILSMVLEHLYGPFDKLKLITEWLKPGGQLIFSIPYFDSLPFKIFKQYSYGLQLPHHITFFNKKIIRDFLISLGYSKIEFYFQYNLRDIKASSSYKYNETGKYIYKFISQNKLFLKFILKPLLFVFSLLFKTSRVSVYAIKGK